jgi:vancomycin resistance protein YoaR
MLKFQNHSTLITLFAVSTLLATPPVAQASENLGYYQNDVLQKIVSQSQKLTYDKTAYDFPLQNFISFHAILIEDPAYQPEIENPYYCRETSGNFSLCDLTQPLTRLPRYKKSGTLSLDDTQVRKYLEEKIAPRIKTPAQNGKLTIGEDGKVSVFDQSKDGMELDIEQSYASIRQALSDKQQPPAEIPLTVKKLQPEINSQDVNSLGITELIAHGESNFAGSPKNRVFNINVALKKFHGLLIKPGEEFSFTTILGEVDEANGYRKELVIKKNQTVPEYGGGVCQVSTTVFRAALNGGMKITERHNHAYPVQYYAPQGTDATIYVPKPDFRFINDTPNYILVQSKIEGTKLSIDFYGTKDERKVEIVGPKVTERTSDGKLKTTLKRIITDAQGNTLREDIFNSFYDNPSNYHRDTTLITEKPEDWSKKQWDQYKKEKGID